MNKTCFEKRIPYTYGEKIKIKPICDIHYGHTLCDVKEFKKYLENSDDKTFFIGNGDLLDAIIVTDKRFRKSIDATKTEDVLDEQIEGMYKLLLPYKDRILGLGIGNHCDTIVKMCNTNPIKRLCQMLDVPYLGYSYFYKLILHENNSRSRTVIIKGHHGYGGGSRTQGGNLTKFAKDMSYYDADIFLYSHVHNLQHDIVPRLSISGNRLIAKPKILCICGTFKKSLSADNSTTWEETKGFPPTIIGGLAISIRPTDKWCNIRVSI